MIRETVIETAEAFLPFLEPARYKGLFGGRGSAKSHFFAGLMCETALAFRGFRGIGIREVQKSLKDSSKRLIEDKLTQHNLWREGFRSYTDCIATPGDGLISFVGMHGQTEESVKSFEGARVAWIEEAHKLSKSSLTLLRPTMRVKGSELWASWNPRFKTDAVDELFRKFPPTGAISKRVSWRDNPWFGETELVQERLDDLRDRPEIYPHIWEGEYASIMEGAYYAKQLAAARSSTPPRIGVVPADPVLKTFTFWDLGKSDKTAIWFMQGAAGQVRVIDYYEKNREELPHYAKVVSDKPYIYDTHYLPPDAKAEILGMPRTREAQLRALLGVNKVKIIKDYSVEDGINAVQAILPRCWFDEVRCETGLEMLGRYHPRTRTLKTGEVMDMEPDHDPSSHGADAFRYFAVTWRDKLGEASPPAKDYAPPRRAGSKWGRFY